jgi:uncharacterized protein YqeY
MSVNDGSRNPQPAGEDLRALRSLLRTDLVAAMKARRKDDVTALRTALADIDNAEAIDVPQGRNVDASQHVAGAGAGVGSTEAPRRVLTIGEVRALLQAQVADRLDAATQYDNLDQPEMASRLRREAAALTKYLSAD